LTGSRPPNRAIRLLVNLKALMPFSRPRGFLRFRIIIIHQQEKSMSPQAGFVLLNEIVPRLKSAIPNTVCFVGCEDAQELVQDAIAFAAKLPHNAEAAGTRVTPGNIAYYVILHMRSGRRSTGSSVVDVMATGTQLNGHTHLVSLEELLPMEEESNEMLTLGDVLSTDHEDPAMIAARRLDWEAFCETQPARSNAILDSVAQGRPLTELAEQHRVDRSTIQNNKAGLAREIKEFMGEDILSESTRLPLWRNGLVATRET
jgi:hypothetical protein